MSNCKKFTELTLMLLAVNINERQGVLPEFINLSRLLNVPKQAVKTDAEINSAGRSANLASPPILGASAEFILLHSYFMVRVCLARLSPKTHVKLG